jgi:LmbE family N-acetylglucosaminyl deacetylase
MNIMVVAAHPDDEILGCGATIAKHVKNGDDVYVLIVSEGATSRSIHSEFDCQHLKSAAEHANQLLGVSAIFFGGFPDNRLDTISRLEVVKFIEGHIEKIQPEVIYTHHSSDVNIDHQILHHAVVTASRPQPGFCVKTLLFFEVPSSTEWQVPGNSCSFQPNWFINVEHEKQKKFQALELYASEMRSWPHPRSYEAIEHLMAWRGATVGVSSAEAFYLGRNIVNGLLC